MILRGTRKSRLSNTLVIVVAAGAERGLRIQDLRRGRSRVALAEPAVPAGIYAKNFSKA
jgi:ABC-type molybdate transport system substrate-binding protein